MIIAILVLSIFTLFNTIILALIGISILSEIDKTYRSLRDMIKVIGKMNASIGKKVTYVEDQMLQQEALDMVDDEE